MQLPITIVTLLAFSLKKTIAAPAPQLAGGPHLDGRAGPCTTGTLSSSTWNSLGIDSWLGNHTANLTVSPVNNVQNLAASFGAPNFFCGLDNFCNAGQPCSPVNLPEWYVLVAIQNWNNYMNAINTAIDFASSILSLTLGSLVNDLYPAPKDNTTPFKSLLYAFAFALSVIPFSGALGSALSSTSVTSGYVNSHLVPPGSTQYVAWSDISQTLGLVVQAYQAKVSDSFKAILDAPIHDPANGILGVIQHGNFLGTSENFTQSDLQGQIIGTLQTYAAAQVLQAQKVFVYRTTGTGNDCDNLQSYSGGQQDAWMCYDDNQGNWTTLMLLQSDSQANANPQQDTGSILSNKYGISRDQYMRGVVDCFDQNGKQQLADPFNGILPKDKTTTCVFNLVVCDYNSAYNMDGIVDNCRKQGLPV